MESLIMEKEECFSTSSNIIDEDEELKALRLACLLTIKKPVQLTEIKPSEDKASHIQTQTLPIRKNWVNKRRNATTQKSNARSNLIVITPGSNVISSKYEDSIFPNDCREIPKTFERTPSGKQGPSRFSRYESNSSSEDSDIEDHKTGIFGSTNKEISVPKHYDLHSGCSDVYSKCSGTCEIKSECKEESGCSSISFPIPLLCTEDTSNTKKYESTIAVKLCSETSNSKQLINHGDGSITVKEQDFLFDSNQRSEPSMIYDSVSNSEHIGMIGAKTDISIKKILANASEISTHAIEIGENAIKSDVSGFDKHISSAKLEECPVSSKSISFEVKKYKTECSDKDTHHSTDIHHYKKRYHTSLSYDRSLGLPANNVSGPSRFSRYESSSSTDESDFEEHDEANQNNVKEFLACVPKNELKNESLINHTSLSETNNHEGENNNLSTSHKTLLKSSKETEKLLSIIIADEPRNDDCIVVNHIKKNIPQSTETMDLSCNRSGYKKIESFDIHSPLACYKSDNSYNKYDVSKSHSLRKHESKNSDCVNFEKPITISDGLCENLGRISNNLNEVPLACSSSARLCGNITKKHYMYDLPVSYDNLLQENIMRNTLKDDSIGSLQKLINKKKRYRRNSTDSQSSKSDEFMDNFPQKLGTCSTAINEYKCEKNNEAVPFVVEKNLKLSSLKSVDSKIKMPALMSCMLDNELLASVTLEKGERLLSKNDLRYALKKKNVCSDSRSAVNCINLQSAESTSAVDHSKRMESEVPNFSQAHTNDRLTVKKNSKYQNNLHKSSTLEKKKSNHKRSSRSCKSEIQNRSWISSTSKSEVNSDSNDKKKKRIASVIKPVESSEELKLSDIQSGFNFRKQQQRLNKKKLNEKCEKKTEPYVEELDYRPHTHERCDSSPFEKKRVPVHMRLGPPLASLKSLTNAWTSNASEEKHEIKSNQSRIQISGDYNYEKDSFSCKRNKNYYYKYPYKNSKCRKHK